MTIQDFNSFQWTTEDGAGRRELRSFYVFFVVLSAVCFAMSARLIFEDWVMTVLMACCGMFFAAMPRAVPRGTWYVDDAGAEFQPRYGRAKRLSWLDVESVAWHRINPRLRAADTTIALAMQFIDRQRREQVHRFVRDHLAVTFDLSEQASQRFSVIRLVILLAVSVMVAGISIGGLLLHEVVLTRLGAPEGLAVLWVCLPPILISIPAIIHSRRHHPIWRKRRN